MRSVRTEPPDSRPGAVGALTTEYLLGERISREQGSRQQCSKFRPFCPVEFQPKEKPPKVQVVGNKVECGHGWGTSPREGGRHTPLAQVAAWLTDWDATAANRATHPAPSWKPQSGSRRMLRPRLRHLSKRIGALRRLQWPQV